MRQKQEHYFPNRSGFCFSLTSLDETLKTNAKSKGNSETSQNREGQHGMTEGKKPSNCLGFASFGKVALLSQDKSGALQTRITLYI